MRLNQEHKNMIYAAVITPFTEDVAKAYHALADKVNGTDFVHKMFDHEKIDISETLLKIFPKTKTTTSPKTAARAEIKFQSNALLVEYPA